MIGNLSFNKTERNIKKKKTKIKPKKVQCYKIIKINYLPIRREIRNIKM